jgi:RHS repeat-associated protein
VSGTTTKFLYDGLNVVQEKNAAGTVTANQIVGLGVDQTFWRNSGGQSRSVYADGLGSTLALTGGTGGVQTSYTYEPYGKPTPTGADATNNPFQFTGREWDGATGLQFNRARYYNPTWGRFVSEDPIGLAGGANLYGYAGNAPTVFTDPMGLWLKDIGERLVKILTEVGAWLADFIESAAPIFAILSLIPGPVGMAFGAVSAVLYALSGDWRDAIVALVGVALWGTGRLIWRGYVRANAALPVAQRHGPWCQVC